MISVYNNEIQINVGPRKLEILKKVCYTSSTVQKLNITLQGEKHYEQKNIQTRKILSVFW